MNPRVSVLMPAYNVADWVERAVASVLNQSMTDLELIVVDDASTDQTALVLESFIRNAPPSSQTRIRVIRQPENRGYGAAIVAGLEAADGDWIWCHDADDTADPTMLEKLLHCADDAGAKIAMCRMRYVDEQGNELGLVPQWSPASGVCTGTEALRRLARGQLNGFQSNKVIHRSLWRNGPAGTDNTYADLEYVSRLFTLTERVAHHDEALYDYTQRTGSVTHALRPTIWDLDKLSQAVDVVIDRDLDPRTAKISKLFFRYRQVYWPMLHKASACPQAALAPEVIAWVRGRVKYRELVALALSGSPGLLIMLSMGAAKVSPQLHHFIYRKHKEAGT